MTWIEQVIVDERKIQAGATDALDISPGSLFMQMQKTQGEKDVQNVSTKATLGHSLASGEILVLLISKARKWDIMPQQELGIVLRGKLSHFLSDCVFRAFEWCFSSSEQIQGKQKCWKCAFISRFQAISHCLAENALQRQDLGQLPVAGQAGGWQAWVLENIAIKILFWKSPIKHLCHTWRLNVHCQRIYLTNNYPVPGTVVAVGGVAAMSWTQSPPSLCSLICLGNIYLAPTVLRLQVLLKAVMSTDSHPSAIAGTGSQLPGKLTDSIMNMKWTWGRGICRKHASQPHDGTAFKRGKSPIVWSSVDTSLIKPFPWGQSWVEQRGSRREQTPGPSHILFHWIFMTTLWGRWYYRYLPN